MKEMEVVVRRCNGVGSGNRKSSSYLINGANGYRFAKCSTWDAEILPISTAKRILKNVKRRDPNRSNSEYFIEEA